MMIPQRSRVPFKAPADPVLERRLQQQLKSLSRRPRLSAGNSSPSKTSVAAASLATADSDDDDRPFTERFSHLTLRKNLPDFPFPNAASVGDFFHDTVQHGVSLNANELCDDARILKAVWRDLWWTRAGPVTEQRPQRVVVHIGACRPLLETVVPFASSDAVARVHVQVEVDLVMACILAEGLATCRVVETLHSDDDPLTGVLVNVPDPSGLRRWTNEPFFVSTTKTFASSVAQGAVVVALFEGSLVQILPLGPPRLAEGTWHATRKTDGADEEGGCSAESADCPVPTAELAGVKRKRPRRGAAVTLHCADIVVEFRPHPGSRAAKIEAALSPKAPSSRKKRRSSEANEGVNNRHNELSI